MYHHYWFYDQSHPGPTLGGPLEAMLKDGYPDIPFCLHWVPIDWTSTWHTASKNGTATADDSSSSDSSNKLLQKQYYPQSDEQIIEHYNWLKQFFHHPNYIKLSDGITPVFMVYTSTHLNPVIKRLKELAIQDGFGPNGLHVVLGQYATHDTLFKYGKGKGVYQDLTRNNNSMFDRVSAYPYPYDWSRREFMRLPSYCTNKTKNLSSKRPSYRDNSLVGIITSFDNTPRRSYDKSRLYFNRDGIRGVIRRYRTNLIVAITYHTCCYFLNNEESDNQNTNEELDNADHINHFDKPDDQYILINAWNEWAEGMILEPNTAYGDAHLKLVGLVKNLTTCQYLINDGNDVAFDKQTDAMTYDWKSWYTNNYKNVLEG